MTTLLSLTIALPLIGALILLVGGRATDAWGHLLGCAAVIDVSAEHAADRVGLLRSVG